MKKRSGTSIESDGILYNELPLAAISRLLGIFETDVQSATEFRMSGWRYKEPLAYLGLKKRNEKNIWGIS